MNNSNKPTQNAQIDGLVFGGGGSKGSYEVGVWKALDEAKRSFSVVTGTSIGALVGAMYTANQYDQAVALIQNMHQEDVADHPFIFPHQYVQTTYTPDQFSLFLDQYCKDGPSFAPLAKRFSALFNFEDFIQSSINYGCMTWNVSACQAQPFYKAGMTKDNFLDEMLASASYFPSYNFFKIGSDYYLDGSFAQIVPWQMALDMGATNLVVITLARADSPLGVPIDRDFLIIQPILELYDSVDFDGPSLMRQVTQGYLEGKKYLGNAFGYLYTFAKEDQPLIHTLCKLGHDILKHKNFHFTQDLLDEIWKRLLGYTPIPYAGPLKDNYDIMYIIEALGLCAGMDLYQEYHLSQFLEGILNKLNHIDTTFFHKGPELFKEMDQRGIQDVIIFFHSALSSFGLTLPKEFEAIQKQFILPFYLALAWHFLEKSQWIWKIL